MNQAFEPTTTEKVVGSVHHGDLWIPSDTPQAAVEANVVFTDEGRIVASAAGLTLVDWRLTDVEIGSEEAATTFRRGDDLFVFAPVDPDAWNRQLAAHRLRSRLVGSPLGAREVVAPPPSSDRQQFPGRDSVGEGGPPVVTVVQSTLVSTPRRVSHWLHRLLPVLPHGFGLPVWIGVAIYTGTANARSIRLARQAPIAPRVALSPVPMLKDPEAIRATNRALLKKLGIGAGVIVALATVVTLAAGERTPNADAAAEPNTTVAVSKTTTVPTTPTTTQPTTTTTMPAAVVESRLILFGTSGMIRTVLEDLMDSTSCEDLTFDLKFTTDNFSFDERQSDRIIRAVDYAQEYGIGGVSCGGLDPYLHRLAG